MPNTTSTLEEKRAYHRAWMRARRTAYFAGKSCAQCDSRDRLELDHVDPSTKVYQPAALWGMSDRNPKKIAELAKCQVLCRDCHLEKSRGEWDRAGAKNPAYRWTDDQIREIHAARLDGEIYRKIGERMGASKTAIRNAYVSRAPSLGLTPA